MSELPPKEDKKKIVAQNLGLVNQLRQRFFDELYQDNKDCYDEFDINIIRESNWQIWRFLRPEKYNLDNALNRLDHALKWRKELGINNRTAQDVPKEFYQVGGIFPYARDKNGTIMIFMRVKVNMKAPKITKYIKEFIAGIVARIDEANNENGFVLVFDFTDAGLRNVDLDMLSYIISLLRYCYPEGLVYCLVYNLPWILRKFWALVKSWIQPNHHHLILFANGDEIKNFVNEDNLPKYLGGSCCKSFTEPPEECKSSFRDMGPKYGFSEDELDKLFKLFENQLKEAETLS